MTAIEAHEKFQKDICRDVDQRFYVNAFNNRIEAGCVPKVVYNILLLWYREEESAEQITPEEFYKIVSESSYAAIAMTALKRLHNSETSFYITKNLADMKKRTTRIPLLRTDSSNVIAVGIRDSLLYILFNSKAVYSYEGVPVETVKRLFNIIVGKKESVGKFVNKEIKSKKYAYKRVGSIS